MDIQAWLRETAEHSHAPSAAPQQRIPQQRIPQPPQSDSSLLLPQPPSHVASPREPARVDELQVDTTMHTPASRPSRHDSTDDESSDHRYARRRRRKTRPDRYHPKDSRQRGQHRRHTQKHESSKSRQKSARNKRTKPDSRTRPNFHAKNVARDRLTLKPTTHLGLFNKGRTSAPIRGRGLPDLVFSEMKFLHKEKDQPDAAPQQQPSRQKRKKHHVHTQEDQISAFFTSPRPALTNQDGNALADRVRPAQDTRAATESTSYVSWSESVPTPDMTSRGPKHSLRVDGHDHALGTENNCPALPMVHEQTHSASPECFLVSSAALSQNRLSRSHSFPPQTSSPCRVNLINRAAKSKSDETVASPSSLPPGPPKTTMMSELDSSKLAPSNGSRVLQETLGPATGRIATRQPMMEGDEGDADVAAQDDTSSDLERVIEHCNKTFLAQQTVQEPHTRRCNQAPDDSDRDSLKRDQQMGIPKASRRRTVRFSEAQLSSSRAPNFLGRSFYELQAEQRHVPAQQAYLEREPGDELGLPHDGLYGCEDDMRDNVLDWEEQVVGLMCCGEEYDAMEGGLTGSGAMDETTPGISASDDVVGPGFWRPHRLY
ncbi:hypothetical protein ACEQ8H_005133 [Pleosporales sp. CAS-2024a]